MAYRDIPHMAPEYLAKAVAALAADLCPDCSGPIVITPTILMSFADTTAAVAAARMAGVPMRNPQEEGGRRVYRRECMACDTEWSPNSWIEPEAPGWKRHQRTATIIHQQTGEHPEAARLRELLLIGFAAHNLAHPEAIMLLPHVFSAPFGEGHELDEPQRAHARNAGVLIYIPARMVDDPPTLYLSDLIPAATP